MDSKKTENSKTPAKKPLKRKFDKKAEINNEIIKCQEKFKQAKVGVIRKLVQKLKNPEKKPKQNLASKAERFTQVLNQLKHTSPKRLGVLALIQYKSGKNYLADQNSTTEQLAVGYFMEHKGVSVILDAILNKLKLNESSDWKKLIKKLFKKKDIEEIKEKAEKAKKKKNSFTETDNNDTATKSKNKKSKQKLEENSQIEKTSKKQNKKESTHKSDGKTEESESSNDSESDDDHDIDSSNQITEAPTTVDEFFITADGSNYLSTAVVNQNQNQNQKDDSDNDSNHKKVYEKKPHESSFFHKSDKKPVKLGSNRFEGTKRKMPEESEVPDYKSKETKVDPELHPSWQAKQKQKPTITEFKGTKITFD